MLPDFDQATVAAVTIIDPTRWLHRPAVAPAPADHAGTDREPVRAVRNVGLAAGAVGAASGCSATGESGRGASRLRLPVEASDPPSSPTSCPGGVRRRRPRHLRWPLVLPDHCWTSRRGLP
jgi:hypothetical protein